MSTAHVRTFRRSGGAGGVETGANRQRRSRPIRPRSTNASGSTNSAEPPISDDVLDDLVDRVCHHLGPGGVLGGDEATVGFPGWLGPVVLFDDDEAAPSLSPELPHLVDACHRLAGMECLAELADDLPAPPPEVVLEDGPRRLTDVMGAGVVIGTVEAADEEMAVAADLFEHDGGVLDPGQHDRQHVVAAGVGEGLVDFPVEVAPQLFVVAPGRRREPAGDGPAVPGHDVRPERKAMVEYLDQVVAHGLEQPGCAVGDDNSGAGVSAVDPAPGTGSPAWPRGRRPPALGTGGDAPPPGRKWRR